MKKILPRLSVLATIAVVFGSVLISCSGNTKNTDSSAADVSSSSGCSVAARTYNVTFVSNSKICDICTVKEGESVSDVETPEKKGYSFDGWYMDENAWKVPFDVDTTIRQDMTVYAK